MTLVIGKTNIPPSALVNILDGRGEIVHQLNGVLNEADSDQTVAELIFNGANINSNGSTSSLLGLNVGDTVVRGPDWGYGDEDGGPGSKGVVEALDEWKVYPPIS